MQFMQIPQQHAPLGGELRYGVEHDAATTIGIRIADAADRTLLGAKRFAQVSAVSFDIAPYLRSALRFVPSVGQTGPRPAAGRTVAAVVTAEEERLSAADGTTDGATEGAGSDTPPASAAAPARTFLPAAEPVGAPALLTSMPLRRLIAAGEGDELTLFTAGTQQVAVVAEDDRGTLEEVYTLTGAGLHLFRVDTSDYLPLRRLTVDAGACGKVVYEVVARPEGAVRLAWRSRAGSVEHYTFPVEVSVLCEAAKRRAYGPEGHVAVATADRSLVLRSAYERPEVLEALAELNSSPEVWRVGAQYEPVDVAGGQRAEFRCGALGCFEVAIRSKRRIPQPWN